jgi:hypothetical protein
MRRVSRVERLMNLLVSECMLMYLLGGGLGYSVCWLALDTSNESRKASLNKDL